MACYHPLHGGHACWRSALQPQRLFSLLEDFLFHKKINLWVLKLICFPKPCLRAGAGCTRWMSGSSADINLTHNGSLACLAVHSMALGQKQQQLPFPKFCKSCVWATPRGVCLERRESASAALQDGKCSLCEKPPSISFSPDRQELGRLSSSTLLKPMRRRRATEWINLH